MWQLYLRVKGRPSVLPRRFQVDVEGRTNEADLQQSTASCCMLQAETSLIEGVCHVIARSLIRLHSVAKLCASICPSAEGVCRNAGRATAILATFYQPALVRNPTSMIVSTPTWSALLNHHSAQNVIARSLGYQIPLHRHPSGPGPGPIHLAPTLRPLASAAALTPCRRARLEANCVTMTRPLF
jgi:hypothetical protein